MLVPTTHQAAIVLLILAFVCLGSWASTLKLAGSRWRFELYYFDFASGAFLLALAAALTLGTLGSELSFNDRIAVAGLRSQAFAIGAGVVFNIGNMLFVASISLIGMAAAFPLVLGLALVVSVLAAGFHSVNFGLLAGGAILMISAVVLSALAARSKAVVKQGVTRQAARAAKSRPVKGLATGIIGGLLIGVSVPIAESSLWGDLGLGAYAGLLMLSIGLLVSALLFNLFFMGIGIEGGRVTFGNYFGGTFRQHAFGLLGGVLWSVGTLASLLAQSVSSADQPSSGTVTLWTEGSVLLAMVWGVVIWKEFGSGPPRSRSLILASAVVFALGLALLAFRVRS